MEIVQLGNVISQVCRVGEEALDGVPVHRLQPHPQAAIHISIKALLSLARPLLLSDFSGPTLHSFLFRIQVLWNIQLTVKKVNWFGETALTGLPISI